MFRNYFRIALRGLARDRFSSALNIGGLAIGMAVAILIGLWIFDEVSYNRNFPNHDRIAAVLQNQNLSGGVQTWWGQAMQLAPALRKEYGNHFKYVITGTGGGHSAMSYGDKKIKPSGGFYDPEIIDMLSLHMIRGNDKSLDDPSAIILSESTAKELFGKEDPMGKTINIDLTKPVKVTGIYTDFPESCRWAGIHFMISFQWLVNTNDYAGPHGPRWGNSWFDTYVMVNDKADMAAASRAIKDVKYRHSEGDRRFNPELFLHPMDRWHLYSDFNEGVAIGGRIQYVRLYGLIGIFVLLLACINFMNLSTARSEKRAKEVGIRKAIGSLRWQLVRQFFVESILIAACSFVLSIVVAQLLLPFFNNLADKDMAIPWSSPLFWMAGLLFTLLTGLLAGSYPALYLSSFRPIKVLKGSFRVGRLAALPRKALVVVQFTVSVILIIGTITIFHQIQYVKDRPVGYTRQGLLMVSIQSPNVSDHLDIISQELKQTGLVREVSASQSDNTNTWVNNMGFQWRGKDPSLQESFTTNGVTPDFGKTTGWVITQGRDFSHLGTDSGSSIAAAADSVSAPRESFTGSFIINETAVKYMGLRHPIGETVKWGDDGKYTIIGVVKDMITQTPDRPVPPMIFFLSRAKWMHTVNIRLDPSAGMTQSLAAIQTIFKKYDPGNSVEYRFADQEYARKFEDDERVGRLAGGFTVLAILISCLGLLGLSAFVAEQRTREIGVRKVLGASVVDLWGLLSQEFVVLVSLAFIIGSPVAFWIMHSWLQNYAYHAALSWWIFAAAALGAIAITLLTVSWQAIRAATANPVNSLRAE
jgi:putative ABC transport system permease protein